MYEDTYIGTVDGAALLLMTVDVPAVGTVADIGNLVRLHRPVEQLVVNDVGALLAIPARQELHAHRGSPDKDINCPTPTCWRWASSLLEAIRKAIASRFQQCSVRALRRRQPDRLRDEPGLPAHDSPALMCQTGNRRRAARR